MKAFPIDSHCHDVALRLLWARVKLHLMQERQSFPEFEPEVIAAAARRLGGDLDRVPTTALGEVKVRGVRLTSRFRKAHELHAMAHVVDALPDGWLPFVKSIYCDGKLAVYTVKVVPCRRVDMRTLADLISDLFVRHAGGHNGVHLSHGPHSGVLVGPRRD
jgi:hypothetical protein